MESSNFTTVCSILLLFVYCLRKMVQWGKGKTKKIVGNNVIIAKSHSLSYFHIWAMVRKTILLINYMKFDFHSYFSLILSESKLSNYHTGDAIPSRILFTSCSAEKIKTVLPWYLKNVLQRKLVRSSVNFFFFFLFPRLGFGLLFL